MNSVASKVFSFIKDHKDLSIYLALFLLSFIFLIDKSFQTAPMDDYFYASWPERFPNIFAFVYDHYLHVNPRFFTSFIQGIFTPLAEWNIFTWRILNSIVLFFFLFFIGKIVYLFNNYFPASTYSLYAMPLIIAPINVYENSVVWVTGSFNYLWPITSFLIVIYFFLKSIFFKYQMNFKEFLLLILPTLYLSNSEQIALIFLTLSLVLIIYSLKVNKKIEIYSLILFLIFLVGFLFLFVISKRYVISGNEAFNSYSIIMKSYFGYAYTVLYTNFFRNMSLFFIITILILLIVYKEYGKGVLFYSSFIPFLYIFILILLSYIDRARLDSSIFYDFHNVALSISSTSYSYNHLSIILGSLILFSTFAIILYIFRKDKFKLIASFLLFGAAIISEWMLSFSPSLYAHGPRIFFAPNLMIIFVTFFLLVEFFKAYSIELYSKKYWIIYLSTFAIAMIR